MARRVPSQLWLDSRSQSPSPLAKGACRKWPGIDRQVPRSAEQVPSALSDGWRVGARKTGPSLLGI